MNPCMSMAAQLILSEIKKGSSKNVVLSPMSITIVLTMLASGSNGETLDQFLQFLGAKDIEELTANAKAMMSLFTSADAGSFPRRLGKRKRKRWIRKELVFSMANALCVDHRYPLKPRFAAIADTIYKTLVKNVNFIDEAKKIIEEVNSRAERETKGLIKEVMSGDMPLDDLSRLCITNALYFEAPWQTPFSVSNTHHGEDFNLLNGESVKVSYMTAKNHCRFFFGSFKDFKLIKLPYKRGKCYAKNQRFSMYIFLPHATEGLRDLAAKLYADPASLQPKNYPLESKPLSVVWIPKLKFSFDFEAQDLIKAKKLTLPFDQIRADFSDMVEFPDFIDNYLKKIVYISKIIQKTIIEVNEKGTKAAVVTVSLMGRGCAPKPSFVADHPFMFMIVEDSSELVVFAGAVLNPSLG